MTSQISNKSFGFFLLFFLLGLLAGCSSAEDKFYDAYKCGRVAQMVGRPQQGLNAARKVESIVEDLPQKYRLQQSQFMLMLMQRFTEDLALYKLSPRGQGEAIKDMYESGTCQKLYK